MTEYDISMIKDNNIYKEQCEAAEENLNSEHFLESTAIMSIALERLTKDLIRSKKIKISDDYLTQNERINILKNNGIITYNLFSDFRDAKDLRNGILHGYKEGNYQNTSSLKKYFLKIMVWYDEKYVPEKINPITELKQYLKKVCDDSLIIDTIEREINGGKITERSQITKRIKEELINHVESSFMELEIKEIVMKEISSGIIKNRTQIEEKAMGQIREPRVGVANIINTENMMKYTIQSTDIDKEVEENMRQLENNTHENKQLQEDYNKYGPQSFTTETVTICENKEQSKMVKEDEIIFNASKSYNYNRRRELEPKIGVVNIINTENMMKYTIQSTDIDKEVEENMRQLENNTHENKQLQEDYNKYGPQSFTTETVTICENKEQSKMVREDEIKFNANKSYNNNKEQSKITKEDKIIPTATKPYNNNKEQSKITKEDKIIPTATKPYNNNKEQSKITKEDEKLKIGVVNIINTENMMKYTIQSKNIGIEIKKNMRQLENNTHENKQLQEDYNKYGPQSFTTETVTLCKNKEQSKMVKEDEIKFNANKSYNNYSELEKTISTKNKTQKNNDPDRFKERIKKILRF